MIYPEGPKLGKQRPSPTQVSLQSPFICTCEGILCTISWHDAEELTFLAPNLRPEYPGECSWVGQLSFHCQAWDSCGGCLPTSHLEVPPTILPASGEPHDNSLSVSECLKMSSRLSRLCTHSHSHVETPGLLHLGQPPWIHRPQPLPLPSPQAPRTHQSGTGDLWRLSLAQDPQSSAHQAWCLALGKPDSREPWGEGPTGASLCVARIGL